MNIKYDEKFITTLRQKLTIGNTRSVHLNSLPGRYANRLDLSSLTILNSTLPDDFIQILLNKPKFNFEISFHSLDPMKLDEDERIKLNLLAKRLNSLYYDNNDNYLEFGIKTFGFGFPLLIRRDKQNPNSIIAAPLLIWNLDLQKSTNVANKWFIKKEDDFPISLNEVLISHIQKDEKIHIKRLETEFLEDSIIDYDELNSISNQIFRQLGIESDHVFTSIEKCVKDKSELKNLTQDKPWILWAGIFGLYRSQKESLIKEYDRLLEKPDIVSPEKLKHQCYNTSSISAVETDPSQIGILNALKNTSEIIIQGPPGCGKSQSLTALISNALVEGKKCLVVCEKKTALNVIYSNLEKIGLSELSAVIDDVYKDRQEVVKKARDRIVELSKYNRPIGKEFDKLLVDINNYRNKINQKHLTLNKPIFGDENWTNVVALYLKSSKYHNREKLNYILNPKDFKYNIDEYSRFDSILKKGMQALGPIGSFENPLFELNPGLFLSSDIFPVVQLNITNSIDETKNKIESIRTLKNNYLNVYSSYIDKTYHSLYQKFNQEFTGLFNTIDDNLKLNSLFNNFSSWGKIRLKLLTIFSKKYQKIRQDKEYSILNCAELLNMVNRFDLINTSGYNLSSVVDFKVTLKELSLINAEIKKWWQDFPSLKTKIFKDAANFIFPKGISYTEITDMFLNDLKKLKVEINEVKLLQKDISLSSPENFSEIELVIEKLTDTIDEIEKNISLIRDLNTWYEFTSTLDSNELNFVQRLLKFSQVNIDDIFRSWYLFWLLALYEQDKPRNDNEIEQLTLTEGKQKKAQMEKIKRFWRSTQAAAIEKYKTKNISLQTLYNLRGSGNIKRNPLRKIISTDFDFFTDFYPVILTNPVACSSIIPLKQNLFDYVIFDEASQLRLEDTFTSMIRGKYKIISGDKHQMPPTSYFGAKITVDDAEDEDLENENIYTEDQHSQNLVHSESLLTFAEDSDFKQSPLDIHYRSRHPNLINFSNAAFYGSRLIPMPPLDHQKPLRFIEVNGIYDSHKGVNIQEAKKVVDILIDHMPDFQSGKLQSAGVGTLNMHQRNQILELIRDKCEHDQKFSSLIENLISSKNFFVKNLENIQGDEKDLIILSTTFGLSKEGVFVQNFGPLNQEKGYKLLNVVITRAKHKLYVCSSIPQNYYLKYTEEIEAKGNMGKGIFYAYLAYAKSLEDENHERTEAILKLLADHSTDKSNSFDTMTESVFEQEVVDYLSQHIPLGRIKTQYRVGGFRIDILIKPLTENGKSIAIECDGASYHSSQEAYAWDVFRQKRLEEHGFIFYRIWSANWWENTNKEVKSLIEFINKNG